MLINTVASDLPHSRYTVKHDPTLHLDFCFISHVDAVQFHSHCCPVGCCEIYKQYLV